MKASLIIFSILFITILSFANPKKKIANKATLQKDHFLNPDTLTGYNKNLNVNLPEPIEFDQLIANKSLTFTNIEKLPYGKASNYPIDLKDGFYGRYTIVEKNSPIHSIVCGYIDVHKKGEIVDSKFSDKDQVIWEILVATDKICVWDSIKVGLPRKVIEDFGRINNGLCIRHGDRFLVCYFNNFVVSYTFENNILKEYLISRKWKK